MSDGSIRAIEEARAAWQAASRRDDVADRVASERRLVAHVTALARARSSLAPGAVGAWHSGARALALALACLLPLGLAARVAQRDAASEIRAEAPVAPVAAPAVPPQRVATAATAAAAAATSAAPAAPAAAARRAPSVAGSAGSPTALPPLPPPPPVVRPVAKGPRVTGRDVALGKPEAGVSSARERLREVARREQGRAAFEAAVALAHGCDDPSDEVAVWDDVMPNLAGTPFWAKAVGERTRAALRLRRDAGAPRRRD